MNFPPRLSFSLPAYPSNNNTNTPLPLPSLLLANSRSISDYGLSQPLDMNSFLANPQLFIPTNVQMFQPQFFSPVTPFSMDALFLPHIQKEIPLQTLAEYATFERQALPNPLLDLQAQNQGRRDVPNVMTMSTLIAHFVMTTTENFPTHFVEEYEHSDSDSEDLPSHDNSKTMYSLPPEIDNQDTNFIEIKPKSHSDEVLIYQDKNLTSRVRNGQTLNKDLLLFFVTSPIRILESFGVRPSDLASLGDVLIEKSIFTKGNSKTIPPEPNESSCVLHAKVVDESNQVMQLCKTCSKKPMNNMFLARKVEVLKDFRLKVIGSIACSGHPTSVNRDLRVTFSIVRKGNLIWAGSSVSFKIFHHRMKLGHKRQRSESSELSETVTEGPRKKPIRMGRPTASDSLNAPKDELWLPEIRDMLPKMRDWGVRDAPSFTIQHFHDSVHISNTFLSIQKNAMPNLASCKFLPSLFEYIHHFSAYRDYLWSIVNGNDADSHQHLEYHKNKMDSIDAHFRSILSTELLAWREVIESFWKLFQYPSEQLKSLFCSCELCLHSHLAFIASFAKNEKRMSFRKIAERLNTLKISTPQWHSSLNGLLAKRGVFNYSLYLSNSVVGQFSRECLRTEEFAKFHSKFLHECNVTSAPKCDATELIDSFNKLVFV